MRFVAERPDLDRYLEDTEIIDWQTPAVSQRARALASRRPDSVRTAQACFEWVRDNVKHSGDHKAPVTTCNASDVLREGTGWCFAKSHLLAALLRACPLCNNCEVNGEALHRIRAGDLPCSLDPSTWPSELAARR